jgi:hypothetical protein
MLRLCRESALALSARITSLIAQFVRAWMSKNAPRIYACCRHPSRRVGERMGRWPATAPCMIASLRHGEHACHGRNREHGSVPIHEFEGPDGTAPFSRATMPQLERECRALQPQRLAINAAALRPARHRDGGGQFDQPYRMHGRTGHGLACPDAAASSNGSRDTGTPARWRFRRWPFDSAPGPRLQHAPAGVDDGKRCTRLTSRHLLRATTRRTDSPGFPRSRSRHDRRFTSRSGAAVPIGIPATIGISHDHQLHRESHQ